MAVLTAVSLLAAGRAPDGRCASEPTEPWSFQVAETEAYRRDVPDAEAHLLDAGCRASSSLAPAAGSGQWPRTDPPGQAGVFEGADNGVGGQRLAREAGHAQRDQPGGAGGAQSGGRILDREGGVRPGTEAG